MTTRRWMVVDVFGRGWRLWSTTPSEPAALLPAEAWVALDTLLHGAFARGPDPRDRVASSLFAIHNALTGGRVSHHEWVRADLGAARRISSSVSESLRRAVRSRHLGIARDVQHIGLPPAVEDEAPDTLRQAVVPETIRFDTYELQVVDELERPLAGIEVVLNTPAGREVKATDGGGVARVDNAPEGFGSARVSDIAEVRALLAGRESQRRRMTKFPEAEDVVVRTLTGARETILLASGVKKTLMIVTRTDVYSVGHPSSWGALTEEARQDDQPWRFEGGREARLFINADGTRASASVVGEAGEAPEFVPPNVEPPPGEKHKWVTPDLYVVQAGDTLQSLAKKYLGDPARFTEIVGHNVGRFASRSPDTIFVGEQLHMPSAAVPVFVKAQAATEDRNAAPGPPEPPRFMQVDLDALHDLLFDGNLDRALGIMASQPVDPPESPFVAPPSLLESLLVAAHRLELALEGVLDPPFAEVPEVYPPMVKKEVS